MAKMTVGGEWWIYLIGLGLRVAGVVVTVVMVMW